MNLLLLLNRIKFLMLKLTSIFFFIVPFVQASIAQEREEEKVDEYFIDFYRNFNRDSVFQSSRINYPLKGEYYDALSDSDQVEYTWTEKDSISYKMHKFEKENYRLERKYMGEVVEEKVYLENSGFITVSKFQKIEGLWYLVFLSISI